MGKGLAWSICIFVLFGSWVVSIVSFGLVVSGCGSSFSCNVGVEVSSSVGWVSVDVLVRSNAFWKDDKRLF